MHICLVIPDLRAGGAQRVIATLAEELLRRGDTVVVITFDDAADDHYGLAGAERVTLGQIGTSQTVVAAVRHNARRVRSLRRAIKGSRPDVILSFIDSTNIVTLLATRGLGVPVVVSERIHPPRYAMRWPWPLLRRLTYPFADAIVMQTERGRAWAEQLAHPHRIFVIANPLAPQFSWQTPTTVTSRGLAIIAAGRLEAQKGFDLLIDAFASSGAPSRGWTLTIYGHGTQGAALRARASDRGVSASVTISGAVAHLERDFASAQIFVLSSRFEGFPNVLIEAMASGCAVIATDCETGPAEIVTDRVDGLLVEAENVTSLRRALDELVTDDALRTRLGARAQLVRERFSPARIAAQWTEVFNASKLRAPRQ